MAVNVLAKPRIEAKHFIAALVWFLGMVFVVYGLTARLQLNIHGAPSIATMRSVAPGSTFRSEDDYTWQIGNAGRPIFEGDQIATAGSSGSVVDFGEGRLGELGPETMLRVTSLESPSGKMFVLNLLKGSVKPTVPPNAKNSLIVTSGQSSYMVARGESKGFTKASSGKLSEFNAKEKFPSITTKLKVTEDVSPKIVLSNVFSKPLVIPVPPLPLGPTAVADATAFEVPQSVITKEVPPQAKKVPKVKFSPPAVIEFPGIIPASIPKVSFTTASLKDMSLDGFRVKLTKPDKAPATWQGGVQLKGDNGSIILRADSDLNVALPPSSELTKLSKETLVGAIPCLGFVVAPAATLSNPSDSSSYRVQDAAINVKICSLADASKNLPLHLKFSSLGSAKEDRSLFQLRRPTDGYPVQIKVYYVADYLKLLPYLRSTEAFQVYKAKPMAGEGIYSVAQGRIAAELGPPGIDSKSADQLRSILGHTLVFQGGKSAFYNASYLTPDQLKDWIRQNTQGTKSIYVPSGSRLIEVSREFISQRREVADFIQKASPTLFLSKVKIVSYKE